MSLFLWSSFLGLLVESKVYLMSSLMTRIAQMLIGLIVFAPLCLDFLDLIHSHDVFTSNLLVDFSMWLMVSAYYYQFLQPEHSSKSDDITNKCNSHYFFLISQVTTVSKEHLSRILKAWFMSAYSGLIDRTY